jgi:hypothetical protein
MRRHTPLIVGRRGAVSTTSISRRGLDGAAHKAHENGYRSQAYPGNSRERPDGED